MCKKISLFILSFFCAALFAFAEGELSVTEIPDELGWGSLSSDGTTIVIAKGENSDSLALYDIESGEEKLVLKGRVVQYPRLDPAGKRIIFTGDKPYAGLWIVGTNGKGLQPFPSKQGASADDYVAMWSPDGTRVAWCRNLLPRMAPQLWIANADGSGARVLVKGLRGEEGYIGWPIDWIEDKILTSGTVGIASPALYIVDASSGEYSDSGIEHENWAQFCESPDYLMYYHYSGDNMLRFWSVPDKAEATDAAPLEMGTHIENPGSYTRSADSSALLLNNDDPNSEFYLHMYLVSPGDDDTEIPEPEPESNAKHQYPLESQGNASQDATDDSWDIEALDTARKVDYLTDDEKDVIWEMNKVRMNPKQYSKLYIEPLLGQYSGNLLTYPGETAIRTKEGILAANDCIECLNEANPATVLVPSKGMSLGAKDHAADQSRTGSTGHTGSDRSTSSERINRYGEWAKTMGENIAYGNNTGRRIVVSLLVDDGVPSRGHRTNILNPQFNVAGTSINTHGVYRFICVMTFAGVYSEK